MVPASVGERATYPLRTVLRFALSDIPVGIHFSFLIIGILSPSSRGIDVAAWTLVAFLAVLLHEVGHAVTARHYGATPVTITLFALGGVTVYPANEDLTPGRRFVIAAAGSIVGIVTGGAVALAWYAGVFEDAPSVIQVAATGYIWAGLGWGVLNWIPIRPLDGGAMLTSALEIVAPRRAVDIARVISIGVGIAASIVLYRWGYTFGAVFILVITAMGLTDERRPPRRETRGPGEGGRAADHDPRPASTVPGPGVEPPPPGAGDGRGPARDDPPFPI
jgi:Zn-dependent protease